LLPSGENLAGAAKYEAAAKILPFARMQSVLRHRTEKALAKQQVAAQSGMRRRHTMVDELRPEVYTREFSNLSSLGLKRSLVCLPLPATLFPYSRIELRNELTNSCANIQFSPRTTDFGFVLLMSSFCWI
jgi:hypothetical protein